MTDVKRNMMLREAPPRTNIVNNGEVVKPMLKIMFQIFYYSKDLFGNKKLSLTSFPQIYGLFCCDRRLRTF